MVERKMGESPNDLVIITGMSGAGRTEAMHAFEDLGYFCTDSAKGKSRCVTLTRYPRVRR